MSRLPQGVQQFDQKTLAAFEKLVSEDAMQVGRKEPYYKTFAKEHPEYVSKVEDVENEKRV